MKNEISQVGQIAFLLTAMLLVLSFFSEEKNWGNFILKKMDILADIKTAEYRHSDHSPATTVSVTAATDTCISGIHIEDFTRLRQGLCPFFAVVDSMQRYQRQVRVAFFGDSFVEGDILLGDLRDTLQSVWGGQGVGFVPMSSEVARYRRSFLQKSGGWNTQTIVRHQDPHPTFGIAGVVSQPKNGAKVEFAANDYFKNTRQWSQVRLFYQSHQTVQMRWHSGTGEVESVTLPPAPRLGHWQRNGQFRQCTFEFLNSEQDSLHVFGASLESPTGLVLDNFSVRGNTGGKLRLLDPELMQAFDNQLHYDLMIVQLGLNAVTNNLNNLPWYEKELEATFAHLRRCFPKKLILLFSVADRGGKVGTEISTMVSVPHIVEMQRNLAKKFGFLFWDMFRGMGGEGAMVAFAKMRPALANTDYTHLTHEGGKFMGHKIAQLFLDEKKRCSPRK